MIMHLPLYAQNKPKIDSTKNNQPDVYYTCVMHPEIHSKKPGDCPKCGMVLVKAKSSKSPVIKSQNKKPIPKDTIILIAPKDSIPEQNILLPIDSTMHNDHIIIIDTTIMKDRNPDLSSQQSPPKSVRYDLYIRDTVVQFTGKPKHAIAVNGQIPMPTLTFTEGDTAEIYVHNELNEETSLHWHGLFLPNAYDGVPYLTQLPIKPHSTHIYKFPVIQHGTHWYHSHTKLQEQIGMYGAMILNKRNEPAIPTLPVVISDWADMKPQEIDRSLHNQTDWFAIKKRTTQSYGEAIRTGHFGIKLTNEWKRMNAMDVSDVAYDRFLINGQNPYQQPQFAAGDKVRLRISNAGASTYFWLTYAGGKITVVANDGNDVEPVEVDRLIIAVSETYDVIVTIPENKSYEFLATAEDRTKSASLWLGQGLRQYATKLPTLKYFAGMKMMNGMMNMKGDIVEVEGMNMQNQEMDMNTVMYPEITGYEHPVDTLIHGKEMQMGGMSMASDDQRILTLNYGMLRATEMTSLPPGPVKELKFDLTGNMNRYVWTLNNRTLSESDKILIKRGEQVRIILFNNSMMRHPMHLHGHDFRVLNGQGDYAPLKNVLDIMPMERDTIEFAANTTGDWFFHCHILYHMMSGMGRVLHYEDSPANPGLPDPKSAQRMLYSDDRMIHFMSRIGIESNGSDGQAMIANMRYKLSTMWHLGYSDMHGYESETMLGRYLGKMQWWYPYVGFDYHFKTESHHHRNILGNESKTMFGQVSNKDNRHTFVAGIAYTLPMLFTADARIDGDGKFRFQLGREDIPVTSRLRWGLMINTDKEYMTGLRYIATKYVSFSSHFDSDMGWGAGVTITY